MRSSTKKLLMYGGAAAAAYYFFMRPSAPAPAPVAIAPGATPGMAGLGYFPSRSDAPFSRVYNGAPTAWWRTNRW